MRRIGAWVISNDPTQTTGKVIAIEGRKVTVLFAGGCTADFYGEEFENSLDQA